MKKSIASKRDLKRRQETPLITPTDLKTAATKDIAGAMNAILADVFALYLKTKNFHWHMSGPHFRDYHLLLDEQGDQLFAMTDPIAERIRKVGGTTLSSIGHIARTQRVSDNDAEYVEPEDMLAELREDNKTLACAPARGPRRLRRARRHRDRQPHRSLDRRNRAAHLVPVRGQPACGFHRPLVLRLLKHAHIDRIPGDHAAFEVGDVRHERGAGGAKAENGIFDDGRASANGVLEGLMMRDLLGVAVGAAGMFRRYRVARSRRFQDAADIWRDARREFAPRFSSRRLRR